MFEVRGVHDENSGAMLVGAGRRASVAHQVEHVLHLVWLHADKQRDVAPAQETTGAGHARHPVALGYRPSISIVESDV